MTSMRGDMDEYFLNILYWGYTLYHRLSRNLRQGKCDKIMAKSSKMTRFMGGHM